MVPTHTNPVPRVVKYLPSLKAQQSLLAREVFPPLGGISSSSSLLSQLPVLTTPTYPEE